MKPVELLDFINDLEARFPVESWRLHGFHIWPVIRLGLMSYLDDYARVYHRVSSVRALGWLFRSILEYPVARLRDGKKSASPSEPVDYCILTSSTGRVFRLPGGFFEKLSDPIVSAYQDRGLRPLVIEDGYRGDFRYPRMRSSFWLGPGFQIRAAAGMYLAPLTRRELDSVPGFHEFAQELVGQAREKEEISDNSTQGVGAIQVEDVIGLLRRTKVIRLWANSFKKTLRRSRPSLAFMGACYGPMGMSFSLACSELGIRSVDIQHGVAGSEHPAYGRWTKVPERGYECLPDIFWSWSHQDARAINDWAGKTRGAHKAETGGNLLLQDFQKPGSVLRMHFQNKISALLSSSRCNALVTLQPVHLLPPGLLDAIQKSEDSMQWWIRLHPDMYDQRNEIERSLSQLITRASINVREASELPLYALLPFMDIHLTGSSAVVYEAREMGVASVVYSHFGGELFSREVRDGIVEVALTGPEILNAMENLKTRKERIAGIQPSGEVSRALLDQIWAEASVLSGRKGVNA